MAAARARDRRAADRRALRRRTRGSGRRSGRWRARSATASGARARWRSAGLARRARRRRRRAAPPPRPRAATHARPRARARSTVVARLAVAAGNVERHRRRRLEQLGAVAAVLDQVEEGARRRFGRLVARHAVLPSQRRAGSPLAPPMKHASTGTRGSCAAAAIACAASRLGASADGRLQHQHGVGAAIGEQRFERRRVALAARVGQDVDRVVARPGAAELRVESLACLRAQLGERRRRARSGCRSRARRGRRRW